MKLRPDQPDLATAGDPKGECEMSVLKRFARDQSGATAIEYGLFAGLIALGIIASLSSIRDAYTALYNKINNGLNS